MIGTQLTNTSGAFGQDPTTHGGMPSIVQDFQVVGSVNVAANDAVAFVWNETDRTLKVEPWDTDASGQDAALGAGVALDAGTAGDWIRVVVFGFALVNIGSGNSATAGHVATGSTTKGVVTSGAGDTNTVVGDVLGVFLGNEDGTSDTAPVWVSPR